MYFSRISINPTNMDAEQLSRFACSDAYHEHQLLWNLFDSDRESQRDFLFRREQIQGWPRYYVVSKRIPEDRHNIWNVEYKSYHPKIHSDQILAFHLRANPVVTHTDNQGKKKRHDVVMNLKKQTGYQDLPKHSRPMEIELVQQAGIEWLRKRAQTSGFEFDPDAIRIDGYTQHRTHKRQKEIRYSTLDYEGLLRVKHPDLFLSSLTYGIGPAKAFGCGLLLARRI